MARPGKPASPKSRDVKEPRAKVPPEIVALRHRVPPELLKRLNEFAALADQLKPPPEIVDQLKAAAEAYRKFEEEAERRPASSARIDIAKLARLDRLLSEQPHKATIAELKKIAALLQQQVDDLREQRQAAPERRRVKTKAAPRSPADKGGHPEVWDWLDLIDVLKNEKRAFQTTRDFVTWVRENVGRVDGKSPEDGPQGRAARNAILRHGLDQFAKISKR
jgi:hypothetical protein